MDIARQYVKQFLSESRKQTQKFEAEDLIYAYNTRKHVDETDGGYAFADSPEKLVQEWDDSYGRLSAKRVLVMKKATSTDGLLIALTDFGTDGLYIYPSIDALINGPTGIKELDDEVDEELVQELAQASDLGKISDVLGEIFQEQFDGLYQYVSGPIPRADGMTPGKVEVPSEVNLPKQVRDFDYYANKLKNNPFSFYLKDVPEKFRTPELCKFAVERSGFALRDVPEELKTPELCKIAVEEIGYALEYVPEKFITPELCKLALKKGNGDLDDVPEELKTFDMCKFAVERNGRSLVGVPEKHKTLELCKIAVKDAPAAIEYVPDELKSQVRTDQVLQF